MLNGIGNLIQRVIRVLIIVNKIVEQQDQLNKFEMQGSASKNKNWADLAYETSEEEDENEKVDQDKKTDDVGQSKGRDEEFVAPSGLKKSYSEQPKYFKSNLENKDYKERRKNNNNNNNQRGKRSGNQNYRPSIRETLDNFEYDTLLISIKDKQNQELKVDQLHAHFTKKYDIIEFRNSDTRVDMLCDIQTAIAVYKAEKTNFRIDDHLYSIYYPRDERDSQRSNLKLYAPKVMLSRNTNPVVKAQTEELKQDPPQPAKQFADYKSSEYSQSQKYFPKAREYVAVPEKRQSSKHSDQQDSKNDEHPDSAFKKKQYPNNDYYNDSGKKSKGYESNIANFRKSTPNFKSNPKSQYIVKEKQPFQEKRQPENAREEREQPREQQYQPKYAPKEDKFEKVLQKMEETKQEQAQTVQSVKSTENVSAKSPGENEPARSPKSPSEEEERGARSNSNESSEDEKKEFKLDDENPNEQAPVKKKKNKKKAQKKNMPKIDVKRHSNQTNVFQLLSPQAKFKS